MATLFQTANGKGLIQSPRSLNAGDVKCARGRFVFYPTAFVAASDKIELVILPPFCRIVDAILIGDTAAAITTSIGLMSGVPNDDDAARTIGTELFLTASINAAEVTRMTQASGFRVASSESPRSIGAIVSANVAALATKHIELLLFYAADFS